MSESSADKSFAARLTAAQMSAQHTPIQVLTAPRHFRTSSPFYVSDLSSDKQCLNKRCVQNLTFCLILGVVSFNLFVSVLLFQLRQEAHNQATVISNQEASINNKLSNRLTLFSNSSILTSKPDNSTKVNLYRFKPHPEIIVAVKNENSQNEILLNNKKIIENNMFFTVSFKNDESHKNETLESTTQDTIFLHENASKKQNDLWISYEGVPIQQPFQQKLLNIHSNDELKMSIRKNFASRAVLIIDCTVELDEKGTTLCKQWRSAGFCESHPATKYLFCRRECICNNQTNAET